MKSAVLSLGRSIKIPYPSLLLQSESWTVLLPRQWHLRLHPTSEKQPGPRHFADDGYEMKRFIGEGGKKQVYLPQDVNLAEDLTGHGHPTRVIGKVRLGCFMSD
jgi:hypothetical protein